MSRILFRTCAGLLPVLVLFAPTLAQQPPAPASAAEVEALRAEVQQLKEQLKALQDQLAALIAARGGGAPATPPAVVPPAEAPVPAAPVPGAAPSLTSNYFNPSISAIGNFLGVCGSNKTENLPSMSLRETEVALQAVVDP
ncbi:MAG: hypothetical protein DMH00_08135, partial [Acidobacteria bacterium]